jgi:sec-independent protein translocase protein TatA
MLSPLEIGAVFGVVVLLFGVKRLPELGSGMGQAISNFKKSYKDTTTEEKVVSVEEEKKKEPGKEQNSMDISHKEAN